MLRARMPKVYGPNAKPAKDSPAVDIGAMQRRTAAARADLERRKAALEAGPAESVPTDEEAEQHIDGETCMVSHVMARLYASDEEIAEALDISADKFKEFATAALAWLKLSNRARTLLMRLSRVPLCSGRMAMFMSQRNFIALVKETSFARRCVSIFPRTARHRISGG